jgi:hypothetical protein
MWSFLRAPAGVLSHFPFIASEATIMTSKNVRMTEPVNCIAGFRLGRLGRIAIISTGCVPTFYECLGRLGRLGHIFRTHNGFLRFFLRIY